MGRLIKNMTLVYAGEDLPKSFEKSIFLAGPTPRNKETQSWRKEALKLLEKNKYDGVVFIPEARNGEKFPEYDDQIDWETQMLDCCDCILFWIPRELRSDFEMIALTTNIEWGKYQKSEKVVIGFPKESKKNKYIQYECDKLGIKVNSTLEDTIKNAIDFVGEGSYRKNGECYVPLNIWNTKMFQGWYKSQKESGNELQYAKLNYVFKMPKAKQIFLWILFVKVYIKDEDRVKENEFVLSRTDISSVVIYKKDKDDILNSDIVLVEEFRSPVRNELSMVFEVPGGSSLKDENQLETIIDEIKEETGLEFDTDRLIFEKDRQLMATLSSHKSYLYSIEINDEELDFIKQQENTIHGVEEDTERTYLKIYKVKEIIDKNIVDWSNIGYILSVLNKN